MQELEEEKARECCLKHKIGDLQQQVASSQISVGNRTLVLRQCLIRGVRRQCLIRGVRREKLLGAL